jgi:hypothetical protein
MIIRDFPSHESFDIGGSGKVKQILRVTLPAFVFCFFAGCGGEAGDPPVVSAETEAKQQEMRKQQYEATKSASKEAYKSGAADDPNARRKPGSGS